MKCTDFLSFLLWFFFFSFINYWKITFATNFSIFFLVYGTEVIITMKKPDPLLSISLYNLWAPVLSSPCYVMKLVLKHGISEAYRSWRSRIAPPSKSIKCHGKDFAYVIIFFVLSNLESFSENVFGEL